MKRREFAVAGGLMSDADSYSEMIRVVGVYGGRILKRGEAESLASSADGKLEPIIILKTANYAWLRSAQTLLGRADEVIE
jgi:hypothetical protein